ncbi:hypothetical protein FRB95_014460 [Tulasnella sp. JGI-2019a]|nr:hypothetical protein FRB95_014460 [Tulasnella sp. JGI-2019a]
MKLEGSQKSESHRNKTPWGGVNNSTDGIMYSLEVQVEATAETLSNFAITYMGTVGTGAMVEILSDPAMEEDRGNGGNVGNVGNGRDSFKVRCHVHGNGGDGGNGGNGRDSFGSGNGGDGGNGGNSPVAGYVIFCMHDCSCLKPPVVITDIICDSVQLAPQPVSAMGTIECILHRA